MKFSALLMLVIVAVLLFLLFKVLSTPIRWAFKLLIHIFMGFVALFLLNLLGGFVGLSLPLTWLNAAVAGVLGVPGVVLLLLIKYLL